MRFRRRYTAVAGAAALACLTSVSGVAGSASAGASTSSRTSLSGSASPAAARQHPVSAVAGSSRVDFQLVLQLRDAAGAQAEVKAVSTPGSASFRHYLTTAQWEARFAPSASEVAAASNWLRSEGFKVGSVSKDHITISASGTATQVERAFGTSLENYKVNGHVVRLATSDMSVPTSLAGTVVGAMGVNQTVATADVASSSSGATSSSGAAPKQDNPFPPAPAAFITAKPCGAYYNQKTANVRPAFGHGYPTSVPYEVCGYVPPQFRSAYNVTSSETGAGTTVAIIDAYGSSTIANDAAIYFQKNDPSNPFANADFTQEDATPFDDESECAASSWLTEQAIDVEAVHGMAPDAHILYVGAQDCIGGLFTAEQTVIDGHQADVVTNSWGDDAGDLLDDSATKTAYDDLFMMADTSGMTVQFSSGDNGDNFNLFGFSSSDYPTESPYVTSVGGTSLQVASKGTQIGQLGWATGRSFKCTPNAVHYLCHSYDVGKWLPVSFDGGGGGFTSYNYSQPWYQAPVVPTSLSERNANIDGPNPMRVNPDISLDADPSTGFLIGLTEAFPNNTTQYGQTRYGGTSLASPLLAGVIADVDQTAQARGGSDVGFINPMMYSLAPTPNVIQDIVPGGKQAQERVDHAFTYIPGDPGFLYSFRELTYKGDITYCDGNNDCKTENNTLSTGTGYDSMTGLGSIASQFIPDLANT